MPVTRSMIKYDSATLYMMTGLPLVAAGAIALGMSGKDLSDVLKSEDRQSFKVMDPRLRSILNIVFAVLVIVAGMVLGLKAKTTQ